MGWWLHTRGFPDSPAHYIVHPVPVAAGALSHHHLTPRVLHLSSRFSPGWAVLMQPATCRGEVRLVVEAICAQPAGQPGVVSRRPARNERHEGPFPHFDESSLSDHVLRQRRVVRRADVVALDVQVAR
eukprot:CAMPEP_0180295090 /NCGR_PEP_ID=MMETSP0988-20121125/18729_1 /TAXON_ID=697907 /ORGANISM="non described non described, Strain CCMP2293" /LENGTH=127 /DNA_ID=CAMNT_0022272477 /DNA_START=95 /DNA_END=478 /DNA_ORIENTATION=+